MELKQYAIKPYKQLLMVAVGRSGKIDSRYPKLKHCYSPLHEHTSDMAVPVPTASGYTIED
jgi:hypothetical protein